MLADEFEQVCAASDEIRGGREVHVFRNRWAVVFWAEERYAELLRSLRVADAVLHKVATEPIVDCMVDAIKHSGTYDDRGAEASMIRPLAISLLTAAGFDTSRVT
jgi:hypothetical protein